MMRDVYRSKMQGAVDRRRSIPNDVFLEIKIPIPPAEVQKAIIAKQQQIEGATKMIKTLENDIEERLKELWDKATKEDRHDAEVAQTRLDEIHAAPETVLRGTELAKRLKQWQH